MLRIRRSESLIFQRISEMIKGVAIFISKSLKMGFYCVTFQESNLRVDIDMWKLKSYIPIFDSKNP